MYEILIYSLITYSFVLALAVAFGIITHKTKDNATKTRDE